MRAQKIEEILETVFTERESGRDGIASILAHTNERHAEGKCEADFAELEKLGLLRLVEGRVLLTAEGGQRASLVVRRNRLAERLLTDLLDLPPREVERQACEFEHVLSAEATESVCALLGHPPSCPHGKPIPPGACCAAAATHIAPVVTSLELVPSGVRARVVFLASKAEGLVSRLLPFGLAPGSELCVRQRSPAYVIELDETTLALDASIAREIFVKRISS
jgi:DtxR family Mn-dependent transcriptional regulator